MKHKRPTVFIAATVLLLAAVLIYIVVTLNSPVATPPVELPDANRPEGPQVSDSALAQYAAVTPETVQAVISSMVRPDGYTRSVTVEDFWEGGASAAEFTVQASGTSTKITSITQQGMRYVLTTENGTWIWYDGNDQAFFSQETTSWDGDQWLRILTYEDLLSLSPQKITAAGYEEHNGVWCVYASYDTANFGYHTTLWVSAVDGLLAAAESYDGETLIYRMTGGTVDPSIPDDNVFLPPKTDAAPASAYRIATANTQ